VLGWLRALPEKDRRTVGLDLMRAQFRWPVGMPLCRPFGEGLWEIRSSLPSSRVARVIVCFAGGELVALHAFIKKTQKTPDHDMKIADIRRREYLE
jgi:phage-related protein